MTLPLACRDACAVVVGGSAGLQASLVGHFMSYLVVSRQGWRTTASASPQGKQGAVMSVCVLILIPVFYLLMFAVKQSINVL